MEINYVIINDANVPFIIISNEKFIREGYGVGWVRSALKSFLVQ